MALNKDEQYCSIILMLGTFTPKTWLFWVFTDLLLARSQQVFLWMEEGLHTETENAFGRANRRFAGIACHKATHLP
jgi:hypothetical protein